MTYTVSSGTLNLTLLLLHNTDKCKCIAVILTSSVIKVAYKHCQPHLFCATALPRILKCLPSWCITGLQHGN